MIKQKQIEPFIMNADAAKMMLAILVAVVILVINSMIETNKRDIRTAMTIYRDCVGLLCPIRTPFFRIYQLKIH